MELIGPRFVWQETSAAIPNCPMQRKVCGWKTATRRPTRRFQPREMDVMHHKTVLVAGLGVLALMVCAGASQADGRKATRTAAQTAGEHKAAYYRKRATRVRGYSHGARRVVLRGGYAYGRSDVTSTYDFRARRTCGLTSRRAVHSTAAFSSTRASDP